MFANAVITDRTTLGAMAAAYSRPIQITIATTMMATLDRVHVINFDWLTVHQKQRMPRWHNTPLLPEQKKARRSFRRAGPVHGFRRFGEETEWQGHSAVATRAATTDGGRARPPKLESPNR